MYHPRPPALSPRDMLRLAVVTLIAVVLAIGINRIVVTDGQIPAAAAPALSGSVDIAFKSETFPLER